MLVGQILFLLIIATVLAVLCALLIARLYRVSMKRLMQAPITQTANEVSACSAANHERTETPASLTLTDNQHAYRRLLVSFLEKVFSV